MHKIETAEQVLQLKTGTQAEALRVMRDKVRKLKRVGKNVDEHQDATPRIARIDFGRWVADCACGGGVALNPTWTEAYCFGCGAVLTNIQYPLNRAEIEATVERRPHERHRFWLPEKGETLDTLRFENMVIGVSETPAELQPSVETVRQRVKGQIR